MGSNLEESWAGLFKVLERMNDVNYRILVRKKRKVLHNVKVCEERESNEDGSCWSYGCGREDK